MKAKNKCSTSKINKYIKLELVSVEKLNSPKKPQKHYVGKGGGELLKTSWPTFSIYSPLS